MIFSLLKNNKNFRNLWVGQLISALGDRLTQMGLLSYIMITASDDGSRMAMITFVSLLPFLIFGPLFGAVTDRASRKGLMIFADVMRAVFVFFVPWIWLNTHSLGLVVVFVFVLGVFSALFSPAKMSIIPRLVHKENLIEANSFMSTTGMIATLIGTLFAGVLMSFLGATSGFYINAFTYLLSAVLIARIAAPSSVEKNISTGDWKGYQGLFSDIASGRRYINGHLWVMRLIQLSSVFSFLSSFAYILVIHYATHVLFQGTLGLGVVLSASGLGMMAGAGILIRRKNKIHYGKALCGAYFFIGLFMYLFVFKPGFWLSLGFLFGIGVGVAVLEITIDTLLQRIIPDHLKGKIFAAKGAVNNFFFWGRFCRLGF